MSGITDPTQPYFKNGGWGWDGSQWRKLAMVWGFSAAWDENLGGTASGATYTVSTSAIPAGEVRVLQAVSLRNNTRVATDCQIWISKASGGVVHLNYTLAPAQFVPTLVVAIAALVAGDLINIHMSGTLAGDAIQAGVSGYKMKIAE